MEVYKSAKNNLLPSPRSKYVHNSTTADPQPTVVVIIIRYGLLLSVELSLWGLIDTMLNANEHSLLPLLLLIIPGRIFEAKSSCSCEARRRRRRIPSVSLQQLCNKDSHCTAAVTCQKMLTQQHRCCHDDDDDSIKSSKMYYSIAAAEAASIVFRLYGWMKTPTLDVWGWGWVSERVRWHRWIIGISRGIQQQQQPLQMLLHEEQQHNGTTTTQGGKGEIQNFSTYQIHHLLRLLQSRPPPPA